MAEDDLRDPRTLPHYILATLAGEQPEGGFNEELHTQNRIFWNNWAVQNLKKSQLNTLIEASIINPIDISKKTLDQIQGLARARGLKDIPSPSEPIDFSYTKWKFDAQFNKFFFPNISIFSHSKFEEHVFFKETHFISLLSISDTVFNKDADFSYSQLNGLPHMLNIIFCGRAIFFYAHFKSAVLLDHSNFISDALFERATFDSYASLNYVSVNGHANFRNTRFKGPVEFRNSLFRHKVIFSNAKFSESVRFDEAHFEKHPPDLSSATLHEDTQFHSVTWPKMVHRESCNAQYHSDLYSHLKRKMEALKRHEAELFFFAKELEALRHCPPRGRAWLISLYGAVSDYGRSVWRPLATGAAVWYSGAIGYRLLTDWEAGKAVGFSAASLGGVLGARRETFPGVMAAADWPVALLATGQSILGAVLIFLIGLALRNRFRIR